MTYLLIKVRCKCQRLPRVRVHRTVWRIELQRVDSYITRLYATQHVTPSEISFAVSTGPQA